LAHNFPIENGEITISNYLNIVAVGLKVGNYPWTTAFINNYEKLLPPKKAELVKQFALCTRSFIMGKHEKVLDITTNFKFDKIGPFRLITAKTIQIRSLFMILSVNNSYYKLFISKCSSFDKHLKREKSIPESRKILYRNFISLIRRMAYAINKGNWDKKKKNSLKFELINNNQIGYKDWLLNVLGESNSQQPK